MPHTEINDFNGRILVLIHKQDVIRFQIAVHDAVVIIVHIPEGTE